MQYNSGNILLTLQNLFSTIFIVFNINLFKLLGMWNISMIIHFSL